MRLLIQLKMTPDDLSVRPYSRDSVSYCDALENGEVWTDTSFTSLSSAYIAHPERTYREVYIPNDKA